MKFAYGYFLMSIVLCCSSNLIAQNVTLGIKGGISIPSLNPAGADKNPLSKGYTSRIGPDGALLATFTISDLISIQTQLEYSSQGAKRSGLQAFPVPTTYANYFNPGTILYANFKGQVILGYLMVPMLANLQWNINKHSPLKTYIAGGPFVGRLLSAKLVTSGNSNVYADPQGQLPLLPSALSFDTSVNGYDQLHTFNFGAELNAGLSYPFLHGNFFLEGGANYGFLNIQKYANNGKTTTGAGTIFLGYSFIVNKRKGQSKYQ